jgi:hypothetical protein
MAIQVFPAPAAAQTFPPIAIELTAMTTIYKTVQNFIPGIYSVNVAPATTNVRLQFATNDTIITTQTTSSGTISFTLTTAATVVYAAGITGGTPGAVVNIEKTADALTSTDIGNGTLDTINTTSTYNQTGLLGILVLGGGAGGNRSGGPNNAGGNGGRAGYINGDMLFVNNATTVTIGAGGIGQTANAAAIAPTNSSFGNLVTANTDSSTYPTGNGGGGGVLTGEAGGNGQPSITFPSWNGNSTTGGGSGGNGVNNNETRTGGGSGIGTGGSSGATANSTPVAATGKAAGGWGARAGSGDIRNLGGDGTNGVVYVLRGF